MHLTFGVYGKGDPIRSRTSLSDVVMTLLFDVRSGVCFYRCRSVISDISPCVCRRKFMKLLKVPEPNIRYQIIEAGRRGHGVKSPVAVLLLFLMFARCENAFQMSPDFLTVSGTE